MKIAIIGDLFVRAALLETALRQALTPLVDSLTLVSGEVDWPDVPLQHDAEIKEFVGEPPVLSELIGDADAVALHVAPLTRRMIEANARLRIIGCCRGGPVNVNVAAATARGIPVVNAPGRNAQAVIEFTLGLILAECRGIGRAHSALTHGVWQGDLYRYDRTGRELKGQTIGLIGFGAVAQGLVPYLRPFDLRILAFDPYVPAERFHTLGVERVELSVLLREADIVSIHARVTPQTTHMLGQTEFAQMKRGAYFINTARGPLVDYAALYAALASGHLAGAGLDTFAVEPPPPDWPLLSLSNLTITPHIAGASQASAQRGATTIAQEIANFVAGRPLQHCVNPAVLHEPGKET
jgi:D-3-phosphoglycerate dehydrogenase / 2-oxoglutarate reductase